MAEMSLGDYIGICAIEVIKARQAVDEYSAARAIENVTHPILSHIPTPRFRLPSVRLTLPVIVTGAILDTIQVESKENFVRRLTDVLVDTLREASLGGDDQELVRIGALARRDAATKRIEDLYESLRVPMAVEGERERLVMRRWAELVKESIEGEAGLDEEVIKRATEGTRDEVISYIKTSAGLAKAVGITIDPRTEVIKSASSPTSVSVIVLELAEEGLIVSLTKGDQQAPSEYRVETE